MGPTLSRGATSSSSAAAVTAAATVSIEKSSSTVSSSLLMRGRNQRKFSTQGFVNRLPKRILLIRHGESLGNYDETAYTHTPDWTIPLTEEGIQQSKNLGKKLREIVGNEPLFVYCSPYVRTKQTLKYVMESFPDSEIVGVREEPRISEQQFGNFQKGEAMSNSKCERSNFGRFYYRFPEGEAGLDVYNRVTSFIATLFRDWAKLHPDVEENMTVLIFTHGLTLRLFLMRWFHYTVREFEESWNPPNASYVCLNRHQNFASLPNEGQQGQNAKDHDQAPDPEQQGNGDENDADDDDLTLTQFRIAHESLELCNLPERIFVYDKHNGRRLLNELIQEPQSTISLELFDKMRK